MNTEMKKRWLVNNSLSSSTPAFSFAFFRQARAHARRYAWEHATLKGQEEVYRHTNTLYDSLPSSLSSLCDITSVDFNLLRTFIV